METWIEKVIGKPSDYWVCPNCNSLNWYENDECSSHYAVCDRTNPMNDYSEDMKDYDIAIKEQWDDMENQVEEWINEEIEFYEDEGYDIEEIYKITIDC